MQKLILINVVQFLLCFIIMGAPTFLLGMSFPWILSKSHPAKIGSLTAWNTLGCLAGSTLSGLILVPKMGAEKTLLISGLLLAGCSLLGLRRWAGSSKKIQITVMAGAVLAGAVAYVRPGWNPYVMTSGVFLYAPQYLSFKDYSSWEKNLRQNALLFYRDGEASNVSVFEMPIGGRFLRINGKTDASSNSDMLTQLLSGYLPVLLHPGEPTSALAIGLGSGVSLGALTTTSTLKTITAVEIEPAVAEAQQWFSAINRDALKDPRVKTIFFDARHFLSVDRHHYDLITSEPSNPWMAGVSTLYTEEAFKAARERLAPGGVFCQWFHSYAMGERDFRMIVRTFTSVFPHAMMFTTGDDDFFLVGSAEPYRIQYEELEKKFRNNPEMQADLSTVNIGNPFSLLSLTFLLEEDELRQYSTEAPMHVDDKPILEHSAPKFLHRGQTREIYAGILDARRHAFPTVIEGFRPTKAEKVDLLNITSEAFLARRQSEAAAAYLEEAKSIDPSHARTWLNWARVLNSRDQDLLAEQAYLKAVSLNTKISLPWFHLGMLYRDQGLAQQSEHAFKEGLKRSPGDPMACYTLADLYVGQGRTVEAKKLLETALEKPLRDPMMISQLRQALQSLGQ